MTEANYPQIITKTEKENFGLKLKIHFLEDLLKKSDPNINQTALKENTDLRVDKATMQRDLAKVKKQLNASAREAENLKQQLLDGKVRSEKESANHRLQGDFKVLQALVRTKEAEVRELRDASASAPTRRTVQELQDNIEDLEAELREKDRMIDAQKDGNVGLKGNTNGL